MNIFLKIYIVVLCLCLYRGHNCVCMYLPSFVSRSWAVWCTIVVQKFESFKVIYELLLLFKFNNHFNLLVVRYMYYIVLWLLCTQWFKLIMWFSIIELLIIYKFNNWLLMFLTFFFLIFLKGIKHVLCRCRSLS